MKDENLTDIKRKDLDDVSRRNNNKDSYKNRYFDGKRSAVDEYSGDKIFYSKGHGSGERNRHFTTGTTSNVDHIKPIDKAIKQYEKDISSGKITTEQLKDIVNSDYNLALTSEKRNKAKGGKTNFEYLKDQLTIENIKAGNIEDFNTSITMVQKQVGADVAVAYNVEACKVNNFLSNKKDSSDLIKHTSKAMGNGAEAAFMTMTVSTINNLVLIATEKKNVKEAVLDIVSDTGGSFITTTGLDLLQLSLSKCTEKVSNDTLRNILSKDLPIQEISAAIMIGGSIVRFINDDITAEECLTEIIFNGVGTLAYSLGMAMGGPAGAIISTIVIGQINKCVLEYQMAFKLQAEKEKKISSLTKQALIEMENQRSNLVELMNAESTYFEVNVSCGYELIKKATLSEDSNGIAEGLNLILEVIQKEVPFKTLQEFDEFFFDDTAEFTF